jgi:thiol:disulfide interchange protein DsbD
VFAAVYYLKPFVPWIRTAGSPALWFLLASLALAVIGIAAGAVHLSFHAPWRERLRKGTGVALVVIGLIGAWMWKMTPKRRLPWVHDEIAAFQRAQAEGKGVLVDFSATWCNPCQELELTFGDDEVYDAIVAKFVPLKFDVTSPSDENLQLKVRFNSVELPSVVFMSADRRVLGRVREMMEPDEMMEIIGPAVKKLASDASARADSPPSH